MNGVFLIVPLFLIRYGLLALMNSRALTKASLFPSTRGIERVMLWIYQTATIAIVIYMLFLKIVTDTIWFYIGAIVYVSGALLFSLSIVSFAKHDKNGFNKNGMYRISRNPMYVAYFVYLAGCALLTQSVVLFVLLCVFQLAQHWIITSEERWCEARFGEDYVRYKQKVRRYL